MNAGPSPAEEHAAVATAAHIEATLRRKILLATDGSQDAWLASRAAADLAGAWGAPLHVVHAWRVEEQRARASDLLRTETAKLKAQGTAIAATYLRFGESTDEILRLIESIAPGVVAIGSRGLGLIGRALLGSASEGVVTRSPCPVLVMRGSRADWPPKRVVVGDDGSVEALRALYMGAAIARPWRVPVTVVRAIGPAGAPRVDVFDRIERVRQAVGVLAEADVVRADPATALLEHSSRYGTILVVGRRGLGRIGRLALGSVSTSVLHRATGPLLVCPAVPGWPGIGDQD